MKVLCRGGGEKSRKKLQGALTKIAITPKRDSLKPKVIRICRSKKNYRGNPEKKRTEQYTFLYPPLGEKVTRQ